MEVRTSCMLAAAAFAAGCAAPIVRTPKAVFDNRVAWNGETVLVRGTVSGECKGQLFMCRLESGATGGSSSLTLAYVPQVEPVLQAAVGKDVVLRARVTDECAVAICLDRGPDVVPIEIIRVIKPQSKKD